MLQAMECEVFYLKRLSIGKVMLDEKLAAGNYRELSAEELHMLETESRK
jgi:16S rRNA pseudouridine516 synthase